MCNSSLIREKIFVKFACECYRSICCEKFAFDYCQPVLTVPKICLWPVAPKTWYSHVCKSARYSVQERCPWHKHRRPSAPCHASYEEPMQARSLYCHTLWQWEHSATRPQSSMSAVHGSCSSSIRSHTNLWWKRGQVAKKISYRLQLCLYRREGAETRVVVAAYRLFIQSVWVASSMAVSNQTSNQLTQTHLIVKYWAQSKWHAKNFQMQVAWNELKISNFL